MINRYLVKEIISEGYERWSNLEDVSNQENIWVHFLQYDEYIDNGCKSKIIEIGDCIEGKLAIDLVSKYNINIEAGRGFEQPINQSSHIVANGMVNSLLDDFSILCNIDSLSNEMLVEFENKVEIKIGDNIKVIGSLEIEITNVVSMR